MTTKAYRVQSRASIARSSLSNEIVSTHDDGKTHHHSILVSAVRSGDPLAAWSAAARLLRSYYPLITPPGQNNLASELTNSADRLLSGTRCADPASPFIRLHSFPLYPSQMDIINAIQLEKIGGQDLLP
ncbi:unnamed protein product [Camellia sinensis]